MSVGSICSGPGRAAPRALTRCSAWAINSRAAARLGVVKTISPPKVWAMNQGATAAASVSASDTAASAASDAARPVVEQPDFLWFTDADIAHEAWVLSALIDRAEADNLNLVSTMATLRVDSVWDRLLIPAFGEFFGSSVESEHGYSSWIRGSK